MASRTKATGIRKRKRRSYQIHIHEQPEAPLEDLSSRRWECDKTLIAALFALFGKQIPSHLFFMLLTAVIVRCTSYGYYPETWLAGSIISKIREKVMWASTVWIVALSILIMFPDCEHPSKFELAILITSTTVSVCLFMAYWLYLLFEHLASFVRNIWKRITENNNSGATTLPVAADRRANT